MDLRVCTSQLLVVEIYEKFGGRSGMLLSETIFIRSISR